MKSIIKGSALFYKKEDFQESKTNLQFDRKKIDMSDTFYLYSGRHLKSYKDNFFIINIFNGKVKFIPEKLYLQFKNKFSINKINSDNIHLIKELIFEGFGFTSNVKGFFRSKKEPSKKISSEIYYKIKTIINETN